METMISRHVDEIPEASRRSLEAILGRELHGNQQVFIMLFDLPSIPSDLSRRSAAAGLQEIMSKAGRHAEAEGVSETDVDAAVTEAMEHVRSRAV
jgi:hypothetical protein